MEIYIIAAISFAIMFTFRYTKDIVFVIREVTKIHEIDPRNLLLKSIYVIFFLLTAMLWPVYLLVISRTERMELIQEWSRSILVQHYELEIK